MQPKSIEVSQVELVGEHPLKLDNKGKPVNPAGCLFLADGKLVKRNTLVTCKPNHGPGYIQFVGIANAERKSNGCTKLSTDEENSLMHSYVPLIFRGRGEDVEACIRPDTGMEMALRAVQLLEEAPSLKIPPGKIKFVGLRARGGIDENQLLEEAESHGMLWRFYPDAATPEGERKFIGDSIVETEHGVEVYYNPGSGERFLTCSGLERVVEEFNRIKKPKASDRKKLADRLGDVVSLARHYNIRNRTYDLSLYNVDESRFNVDRIEQVKDAVATKKHGKWKYKTKPVKRMLSEMLADYREATGADFREDKLEDDFWRESMYRQLKGIPRGEEYRLGLSREFYAQIQWLPGAMVRGGRLILDKITDARTRDLMWDFQRKYPDLEHINIGRIIQSMSKREKTGEEREVYIAVIKRRDEPEKRVHFLRKQSYDTKHFMQMGQPFDKALESSQRYARYYMNCIKAIRALGIERPEVMRLDTIEQFRGETIPVEFFDRPYLPTIASDKIPSAYYGNVEFMKQFAALMGRAAADNIVISRVHPKTGKILFDDGDEGIRFNKPITEEEKMPVSVVLHDIIGSFDGIDKPDEEYTNVYAEHMSIMLGRMRSEGVSEADMKTIVGGCFSEFREELVRIQGLCERNGKIQHLFDGTEDNEWDMKGKWARTMQWLKPLDAEKLEGLIKGSNHLKEYADIL